MSQLADTARPDASGHKSVQDYIDDQIALIFAGFMIFNFMANIGPNAQP